MTSLSPCRTLSVLTRGLHAGVPFLRQLPAQRASYRKALSHIMLQNYDNDLLRGEKCETSEMTKSAEEEAGSLAT